MPLLKTNLELPNNKPTLFISYSHDNDQHKAWVLKLATRLYKNWVNVILDQWDLSLGSDLPYFMEQGLTGSNKVLCICSENYVSKADEGKGGVGYEKMIITSELMKSINTNWVIPVVTNNAQEDKVPVCLRSKVYIDFTNPELYDIKYEELIRDIHGERIRPIPSEGAYPFKQRGAFSSKLFSPSNEKYHSPLLIDTISFDYSNNNGGYNIGEGIYSFETKWSKCSSTSIYVYSDGSNIDSVAHAKGIANITDLKEASSYDTSSRAREIPTNQIAVFRNSNGFYAAVKVLSIVLEDYEGSYARIVFQYYIQTNGSDDFSSL